MAVFSPSPGGRQSEISAAGLKLRGGQAWFLPEALREAVPGPSSHFRGCWPSLAFPGLWTLRSKLCVHRHVASSWGGGGGDSVSLLCSSRGHHRWVQGPP